MATKYGLTSSGRGSFKAGLSEEDFNKRWDPGGGHEWYWDPNAPALPVPGEYKPPFPTKPGKKLTPQQVLVNKAFKGAFSNRGSRGRDQGGDVKGAGSGIRGGGMGSNYGPGGYQGGTYGGAGGPSITEGVGGAYKNR